MPAAGISTRIPWSSEHRRLLRRTLINLRTGFDWARLDIVCQYRRSKIGPVWETLNVAVMLLGLTYVSAAIFGGNVSALMGYVGLGIITWSAISGLITEGCATFSRNATLILSSNISIDLYIQRTVFKVFLIFGHHFVLYFIGLALNIVPLTWVSLLALPGLLLLFVNAFWVVALLAFVCARFRDVEMIIRNLLQLVFLVTPIFWNYEQIPTNRAMIVDYNPFFYFVQIVRAPLLGTVPSSATYITVIFVTVVGYVAAYFVYQRMRRHLAFFV